MWIFWLLAAISFAAGAFLWARHKEISAVEWLGGAAAGLALAGIFQICSIKGMTGDVQTISGQVTEARYVPAWTEQYTYYITHTRRVGKTTTTYRTRHTGTRTHNQRWLLNDSLGRELEVSDSKFAEVQAKFGGKTRSEPGRRRTSAEDSRMISGDPNDVVVINSAGFIEPVTKQQSWTNRVKAAPSVFSFPKVPKGVEVFEYPTNPDPFVSERRLGTATSTISALAWDQLNARLGPSKQVNVIAVGFGDRDLTAATWQEAKWIGGKKNDLVICYGGPDAKHPTWVKVFGWTESDECKYHLQSLVLEHSVDDSLIPKLEAQIISGYTIKDWSKFDYLQVEPPTWAYFVYLATVLVVQGGLYWWFFANEHGKGSLGGRSSYRRRYAA